MSSSDARELKAGHPPAVKAGGMRVVTKHRHKEHDSDAYDEKYQDSVNAMAPPVKLDVKNEVTLPGGAAKVGKLESPTQAVKSYHDKPQPSHSYSTSPSKPNIRINQPRKN